MKVMLGGMRILKDGTVTATVTIPDKKEGLAFFSMEPKNVELLEIEDKEEKLPSNEFTVLMERIAELFCDYLQADLELNLPLPIAIAEEKEGKEETKNEI